MTDQSAAILSSSPPRLPMSSPEQSMRSSRCIPTVCGPRDSSGNPAWIVTADEALADEGEVSVKLADGTARPASIAGRDHTTDIALLRFDTRNIAPAALSPVVPDLGSLSVVVAAEHGAPTAALGTVPLVGGSWRSLRGGEIDARIELARGCATVTRGASLSMPPVKRSAWLFRGCDAFLSFRARRSTGSPEGLKPMAGSRGATRGRAAARQARRWRRRDGDECR